MALSVKCSFVLIVKISDRRPDFETAYIACERAIRSQNTGVHGDVVHKNCICRSILRRAVSQCAVYESGKPQKLSYIGYLVCVVCRVEESLLVAMRTGAFRSVAFINIFIQVGI